MPANDHFESRYNDAANKIFAATGRAPTVRQLRAELGGGSFRDIGPWLRSWRPTSSALTQTDAELVPKELMLAEMAKLEQELDGARRHLMMETDRVRQEGGGPWRQKAEALQAKCDRLESDKLLLTARIEVLQRQIR